MLKSKTRHGAYCGFSEGMIRFPPTYKMEPTKNNFMSGKDWRIPGWCDRILFCVNQKIKEKN